MKHTEMCVTICFYDKHHIALWKRSVVFFYLLKIITKAIIKANAIIVITTKLSNNKYIINNTAFSII